MRSLAVLVLLCLAVPARADAAIAPAETLDGPSADIVDFGGVAMAPDGTGGLVYRRLVDGRPHVFAAQFAGGRWRAPQRVDAGQRFDSSWPAIGAGDGGRLAVSWVQEAGASDRMYAATLAPGSRRFGAPVPVDLDLGEPAAVFPSMAIARGGTGYLAYWVTERDATLPPGFVGGELRVARYSGELWSGFGVPLNRNPSAPVRPAAAATGPRVTVDATGAGILAWVEPDDELIDRVWARRLFGSTFGFTLPVSPQRWEDRPLRGPADAFALDQAGFGQGAIVFRQQPGTGGALPGPRVMVSTIGETFTDQAREFSAPVVIAEDAESVGAAVVPGGALLAPLGAGGAALAVSVDEGAPAPAERLDPGTSSGPASPLADLAESGAAAFAWRQSIGGRGSVALRERRADGTRDARTVFAQRGGAVGDLRLAGSGAGDVLVGWIQGTRQFAQIAGAAINAPPGDFSVATPADFVRPERVRLRWDTPVNAIGRLRYTVTVADETVAEDLRANRLELRPEDLEDGVLVTQVIAVDDAGQETSSVPAELRIDGTAPTASVGRTRGRGVRVRVTDDAREVDGGTSGVDPDSVRVRFGDGREASGRLDVAHAYRRPGRYRIAVTAADAIGNRRTLVRQVTVR